MSKFLKIGVIGGAGPMASVFLCQKIFSLCQKNYNSCDYSDFPEVVLISYPFKRGDAYLIQKDLQDLEKRLLIEVVDVFCIASHSFHGYFKPHTALKFLSLADLTYSRFKISLLL
jgi:aspartate/glutamate racemase